MASRKFEPDDMKKEEWPEYRRSPNDTTIRGREGEKKPKLNKQIKKKKKSRKYTLWANRHVYNTG